MASKLGTARAVAGLLGATALSLSAPVAMAADAELQRRIDEMRQRMQQIDDQLQAAGEELDSANRRVGEQSLLIEQSGLAETRGASSGLPGFLSEITIDGNVAATYFYNLNDPNDATYGGLQDSNTGINGAFYPLTPDHNSFALQQVWLDIARPATEEQRAGFLFEPVLGKVGQLNNVGGISNRDRRDDTGLYISQAYVEYLAPIGDGLRIQAGKYITWIGLEMPNSLLNWNITLGSVYQLLEPLDHIGVQAIYEFGDSGFEAALGGVNGYSPDDPDRNDGKSVLGHVGWSNDTVTASVNGMWGAENEGDDGSELGVLNANLTVQATDRLAFWVNGDYLWQDEDYDPAVWGIAAAGRFEFTERTGLSVRGEYVADVNEFLGFGGFDANGDFLLPDESLAAPTGVAIWGITATLHHHLTDHLMLRGEVRYDRVYKDDTDDDEFFRDSGEFSDDQIVLGAEVIYSFSKLGGE